MSEDRAALEGSPGPVLGDGGTGPRPSPEPSTDTDEGQQKIVPDSWITAAGELPQHVQKLYIDTLPCLDNGNQARRLREVLIKYADVFAKHDLDIRHFSELVHYIKTGQANSIKQHMRRTPLGFENVEQKTLKSMKDAGVIEPSNSDWASPPVLVRKKDNSWRYCIDFRALNAVTVKDAYPLPPIDDCIDGLAGKELFCTLDMSYWRRWLRLLRSMANPLCCMSGMTNRVSMDFSRLCSILLTPQWRLVIPFIYTPILVAGKQFWLSDNGHPVPISGLVCHNAFSGICKVGWTSSHWMFGFGVGCTSSCIPWVLSQLTIPSGIHRGAGGHPSELATSTHLGCEP